MEDATLGEIVVTARRRSESLQEVPQVVNAISADTLAKLQIKDFRDVQTVVPGVVLKTNGGGFASDAEMRGVTFNATTSAQPTVALYLDDAVINANFLFNTMFDIGQIEILRGPQGTNRGVAAPSGAITVTTRKPDLSQFGGYIDVTATDHNGRNLNGALNIPVIKDVLAVRLAGAVDENEYDGYRSIYSKLRPSAKSSAVRFSVSYEPTDSFNANFSYMHLDRVLTSFIPVTGAGFAGLPPSAIPGLPPLGLAATPFIDELDRVGVQDNPNENRQQYNVARLRIDSRVFGQHLSYTGGWQWQKNISQEDRDSGQNLVGVPFSTYTRIVKEDTTHEIRLSSDPEPGRLFDYVVGAYYSWEGVPDSAFNTLPASFLPIAFGSPLAPSVGAFDSRFQVPLVIPTPSGRQEISAFASLTLHLGDKTEITAGGRRLWTHVSSGLKVGLGEGLVFVGPGIPCALATGGAAGPVAGSCTIPGGATIFQPPVRLSSEKHNIYSVSLSHRFSSDLMVYGNVGTSYRAPYTSIGFFNASNDPVLTSLAIHPHETSRAFEVGFKWTFLEKRGRLNAAVFRQKFKDLPIQTNPVPYVANQGAGPTLQTFAFVADPNATVDGFDIDAAFQITPNWNVSGQLSYADGRATSEVPCNDSNFDGTPDNGQVTSLSQFPPGVAVALCKGGSITQSPYWNATVQTEYTHPMSDDVDAYVRGLFTYYPKNARATPATVIDNYSLLNLYAGVRAHDGAWEAGLFVRNALKTEELTFLNVVPAGNINSALGTAYPGLVHNSGYVEKSLTAPREVGINVRYAFGSR